MSLRCTRCKHLLRLVAREPEDSTHVRAITLSFAASSTHGHLNPTDLGSLLQSQLCEIKIYVQTSLLELPSVHVDSRERRVEQWKVDDLAYFCSRWTPSVVQRSVRGAL